MSTVDEPHYRVRVADHGYWREQIKCQYACPVRTGARGYVRAIAAGDYERAYLIARGPNPLASLCGRICGAPCEAACRRGTIDQPISIRALKHLRPTIPGASPSRAPSSASVPTPANFKTSPSLHSICIRPASAAPAASL